MATPNSFDFSDPASAARSIKKVSQLLQRAGQPIISSSFDSKLKRSSGISYREAMLTLASGQTVTLRVTQTGDVFQILLNGSVRPIHNHDDPVKAAAEIAKMADANQEAFQKTLSRAKVALPAGIKTAAPRMEVALQSRSQDLDGQIAERQKQVSDLRAELGENTLDDVNDNGPAILGDVPDIAKPSHASDEAIAAESLLMNPVPNDPDKGGIADPNQTDAAEMKDKTPSES